VTLLHTLDGRTIYEVRMTCGCQFWEHRPTSEAPPERGRIMNCYNPEHHRRMAGLDGGDV
jgi:hypothetical protein